MRPVSGDVLVTAALQSSLARAQRNFKLKLGKKQGSSGGGVSEAVKTAKALKFESEFSLWVEQAQELTFVSEGFSNGASVPEDIECLNPSVVSSAQKRKALKKLKKATPDEPQECFAFSEYLLSKKAKKMKDMSGEKGETKVASAPLRPETPPSAHNPQPVSTAASSSSSATSPRVNGNSASSSNTPRLPQPKRVLYPREKIVPGYTEKLPVGAGFYNMGNSCYLNASLQAVFHVPAFINWLRADADHRKNCQDNTNCIICAMKKTFDSASRTNPLPGAIRPVEIINRLRSICRHFSHGRQEDAHEFLRYLFESMERSYLHAINGLRLDNRSKETNPLGQIFGGYIRTEVTCLKCHYVSTTFQPTAELQLDIRHVTTLEDAILHHFKKERLDNNDYKCEKCRTISQATKQFSLEIPPIVLCLQLKRFTLYGTKIAKRIHCNRFLDMSKYMHKSKQVNGYSNLKYRLVALVTHLGSSPNCGHYTAIAEASNGHFYQFDDSFVHQVTAANALNNDAYVIIYEMDRNGSTSNNKGSTSSGTVSTVANSSSSSNSSFTSNISGLGGFPSSTATSASGSTSSYGGLFPKVQSVPIPKVSPPTSTASTSRLVPDEEKKGSSNGNGSVDSSNGDSSSQPNGAVKGILERKMITFGVKPKVAPTKINILKSGASLTNSSPKLTPGSPSSKDAAVPNNKTKTPTVIGPKQEVDPDSVKLVPYNSENSEEEKSDGDENGQNGARAVSSNDKRLKSPNSVRKQSPEKSDAHKSPETPPRSPKAEPSVSPHQDRLASSSSQKEDEANGGDSSGKPQEPIPGSSNTMKRKAPSDDETSPRKSRPHRRRRSSSSSSNSSLSRSSSGESRPSSNGKRKRHDESTTHKSSENDKKHSAVHSNSSSTDARNNGGNSSSNNSNGSRARESYSEERDRERRRDRNPSRNTSPSVNKGGDRESSTDKRRENVSNGSSFDLANLRKENSFVSWDGQKSALSRSMDEERQKSVERSLEEEYDDEFDQGRIKKVRRSRSLPRDSETSSGGNRFQNIEDRKKQMHQWSSILDGYGPGFRHGSSSKPQGGGWCNGEDSPRDKRNFQGRPGSSNGNRPRHSSTNGSSHPNNNNNSNNYSRNSHGRSPYRGENRNSGGHYNNGGGGNHYRSQSHGHGSYYHNNGNGKHWNNHDRNRYN